MLLIIIQVVLWRGFRNATFARTHRVSRLSLLEVEGRVLRGLRGHEIVDAALLLLR